MRRYICLLFCVAMSLLLLAGCKSSSNSHSSKVLDWEPSIYKTVNNLEGVTMTAKKGTVSAIGLTVIFENNSDKQCIFGEYFHLEKKIEGNWYQVPVALDDNYGFGDIGYDLDSSSVKEWTVKWDWLYGRLDSGDYRIVKNILDFRKTGDYEEHYLAAEFTVNEN